MPFRYPDSETSVTTSKTDVLATRFNIPPDAGVLAPMGVASLALKPEHDGVTVIVEAAAHNKDESFRNTMLPDAALNIRPSYKRVLEEVFGRENTKSIIFVPSQSADRFGLKVRNASLLEVATALQEAGLSPEGTIEAAQSRSESTVATSTRGR